MTWLLIVAGVIGPVVAYAAGCWHGRRVEAARAETDYAARTQALNVQLANDEWELAYRREADHAAVVGPDLWRHNGVGYLGTADDSPTRSGAGQPKQGVS